MPLYRALSGTTNGRVRATIRVVSTGRRMTARHIVGINVITTSSRVLTTYGLRRRPFRRTG